MIGDLVIWDPEVEWKLKELDQWIEMIRNLSLTPHDGFNNNPSYDAKIMQALFSWHFNIPQLQSYEGTTDPINHLGSFKVMMLLHGTPDPIICRAFLSTLKGAARHWYLSLKLGTVYSFEQLSRSFINHFVGSWRQQRWLDYVHILKQKEGKSIQAFISYFNMAILEVCDLNQLVVISILINRLQKNDLKKLLIKIYPRDFADMLARVEKYA